MAVLTAALVLICNRLALYLDTRTFRSHFNSQNTHSQFCSQNIGRSS